MTHVLVLGLGSIGRRHARCFLAAGAEKVTGFDPSDERRVQFTDELDYPAVADEDEALGLGADLVVVASPNAFHARQVNAALDQGVAVFVEKPLAIALEDGEAIAARVAAEKAYLHMGSNWKFHPAFRAMKEIIANGQLGQVTGGQVVAGGWLPDWHPYEDYRQMYTSRRELGGGAVFDTHELDYLSWLLGPLRSLTGRTAQSGCLEIETEDVAAAVLEFESGALVTLLTDYIQRVPQRRYFLNGDQGTLEWDLFDQQIKLSRPGRRHVETIDVELADLNEMYVAQAAHVLEDLHTGRSAMTPAGQALQVLRAQMAWKAM